MLFSRDEGQVSLTLRYSEARLETAPTGSVVHRTQLETAPTGFVVRRMQLETAPTGLVMR